MDIGDEALELATAFLKAQGVVSPVVTGLDEWGESRYLIRYDSEADERRWDVHLLDLIAFAWKEKEKSV